MGGKILGSVRQVKDARCLGVRFVVLSHVKSPGQLFKKNVNAQAGPRSVNSECLGMELGASFFKVAHVSSQVSLQ